MRVFTFSFLSSVFVIAIGNTFMIVAYKSLCNSKIFIISLLASVDCLVLLILRFFLFFNVMRDFLMKRGYFGYYETLDHI